MGQLEVGKELLFDIGVEDVLDIDALQALVQLRVHLAVEGSPPERTLKIMQQNSKQSSLRSSCTASCKARGSNDKPRQGVCWEV